MRSVCHASSFLQYLHTLHAAWGRIPGVRLLIRLLITAECCVCCLYSRYSCRYFLYYSCNVKNENKNCVNKILFAFNWFRSSSLLCRHRPFINFVPINSTPKTQHRVFLGPRVSVCRCALFFSYIQSLIYEHIRMHTHMRIDPLLRYVSS